MLKNAKKDFAKLYERVIKGRHLEFLQWFDPGSKFVFLSPSVDNQNLKRNAA